MKYQVRTDLLQEADKCRHSFSCLSGGDECLCQIKDSFDGKVLFVAPPCSDVCDYIMSFGYSYVCKCPVRKEIYNQYSE